MTLWNTLEKIRNKPEPARQAIAIGFAVVITIIIIGAWLWFKTIPESPTPTAVGETPSPAKILWNYINDLWE